MKNLNECIKQIRKEKGLTQQEVADKLGYSRSLYVRIENGAASLSPYIDKLIGVLGSEVIGIFPFDINKYTNHKLFIYILVYGVDYKTVGEAFGIQTARIKRLVLNSKKKYILEYKDEIDRLFPEIDTININQYKTIGNNSVFVEVDHKEYVFLNVLGNKKNDTIFELMK